MSKSGWKWRLYEVRGLFSRSIYNSDQGLFTANPRRGRVIFTHWMNPLTSPVQPFPLAQTYLPITKSKATSWNWTFHDTYASLVVKQWTNWLLGHSILDMKSTTCMKTAHSRFMYHWREPMGFSQPLLRWMHTLSLWGRACGSGWSSASPDFQLSWRPLMAIEKGKAYVWGHKI